MYRRSIVVLSAFLAASGLTARSAEPDRWATLRKELTTYRSELNAIRSAHGGVRKLPAVPFFLFGMGDRQKLAYRDGVLRDARTGREVHRWAVKRELIVPSAYTVALETRDGGQVFLAEDEQAVWLEEGGKGKRTPLTRGRIALPTFAGHRFASVLRVLHQEVLVNVIGGKPVPNFMVYGKPWYRDGAMMAMVLERTNNLGLIKDWVLGLREPYDRNNAGETEADNLGEALYLISLFSNREHPLVPVVLRELKRFEKGRHIEGRSDFALHPVYQTLWAKYGLKSLGFDNPYEVPQVADSYGSLFWMDPPGDGPPKNSVIESDDYPYLTWAGSHTNGLKKGKLSDQDYPLTWEANASQADYRGMSIIDPVYVNSRLCVPHTWHAAEAFLSLSDAVN